MSVLEKYKLIEKEGEQVSSPSIEEKEEPFYVEDHSADEETIVTAAPIPENPTSSDMPDSSAPLLDCSRTLTLEEIYSIYNLNGLAITDTVFVLENLINALPTELPEYVKKTTVNNILVASAMNLEKLLEDGNKRATYLSNFANDYDAQSSQDINTLKQEIAKLTAIISDYHQQIKYKETLLQEQTSLIQAEEARLNNILGFFKK